MSVGNVQEWETEQVVNALKNLVHAAGKVNDSSSPESLAHVVEHFQAVSLDAICLLTMMEAQQKTGDKFKGIYADRHHFAKPDECVFCGSTTVVSGAVDEAEKKPPVHASEQAKHNVAEYVAILLDAIEEPKRVYQSALEMAFGEVRKWVDKERDKKVKAKIRREKKPENVISLNG